jgi:hypothetical protein
MQLLQVKNKESIIHIKKKNNLGLVGDTWSEKRQNKGTITNFKARKW